MDTSHLKLAIKKLEREKPILHLIFLQQHCTAGGRRREARGWGPLRMEICPAGCDRGDGQESGRYLLRVWWWGFPGDPVVKNPSANVGMQVRYLVWEDSTCLDKATKSVSHNYWAHGPQLLKPVHPRAHAPQQEKPLQREAPMPQLHKAGPQQWRPSTATHTKN